MGDGPRTPPLSPGDVGVMWVILTCDRRLKAEMFFVWLVMPWLADLKTKLRYGFDTQKEENDIIYI